MNFSVAGQKEHGAGISGPPATHFCNTGWLLSKTLNTLHSKGITKAWKTQSTENTFHRKHKSMDRSNGETVDLQV